MLPAVKNGKLFIADFSDFYLAVSASVNDANYRRPNSFITPMTRDMDRKYAASGKNGKLFIADFSDFYLAVSASVKMIQTTAEDRIHLSHP